MFYTNWINWARTSIKLFLFMLPRSLFPSYSPTLLSILFFRRIKLLISIKPSKLHVASNNPFPVRPLCLSRWLQTHFGQLRRQHRLLQIGNRNVHLKWSHQIDLPHIKGHFDSDKIPVGHVLAQITFHMTALSIHSHLTRKLQKFVEISTSLSLVTANKPTLRVLREEYTNASNVTNGVAKLFVIKSTARSLVANLQYPDSSNDEINPEGQDSTIFGLPAVTNPVGTLKERHILWTLIISAGEKLPLPLDSCCSVSLVSRPLSDLVASKCPQKVSVT